MRQTVESRSPEAERVEDERTPTNGEIFEVLSNGRRRFVFQYLKQQQRRVYLREVAEQVAAWENDKSISELTASETKRVKTALHQHHLPKMDSSGFITYDTSRETMELAESVSNLEVYYDIVPGIDIPWSIYYLGLSGVSLVVLVVAWSNSLPIPPRTYLVFITVTLLVSAVIHTYLNHSRLRLGSTEEPPEVTER